MNSDRPVGEKRICGLVAFSLLKHSGELFDLKPGAHVLGGDQDMGCSLTIAVKKHVTQHIQDNLCTHAKRRQEWRRATVGFFFFVVVFYLCNVEVPLDGRPRAAAEVEGLTLGCRGAQEKQVQHLGIRVRTVNAPNRVESFG